MFASSQKVGRNIDKERKNSTLPKQQQLARPYAQKARKTMTKKMFSIRDQKTEVFNTPFFNHTHGEAERNFRSLVNDDKSMIHNNPEDFDLYYLGEYDDNTGKFEPVDTPQHLIKAVNCLNSKQN